MPKDVPTHIKMRFQNYSHTHLQVQAQGGHANPVSSPVEGVVPNLPRAQAESKTASSTDNPNDPRALQVWTNASYKEFLFFII